MTCETLLRTSRLAREQQVERFGRRDQDIRRLPDDPGTLARRCIPAADGDLQGLQGGAQLVRLLEDALERDVEVEPDIFVESLERGNIEDPHALFLPGNPPQQIEGREKSRESLARAGGGDDERVLPGGDRRPAESLGRGRRTQGLVEPCRDWRQEPVQDRVGRLSGVRIHAASGRTTPGERTFYLLIVCTKDHQHKHVSVQKSIVMRGPGLRAVRLVGGRQSRFPRAGIPSRKDGNTSPARNAANDAQILWVR